MIARLAITPEALADVTSGVGRIAKQDHERFLRLVVEYGALVFPDDQAASEFVRFLRTHSETLPPGVAKKWTTVLTDFVQGSRMWAERPPLVPSLHAAGLAAVAQAWAPAVDVVVVDASTGAALGVPDSEGWMVEDGSGLEVAYPDAVPDGEHLQKISHVRNVGNLAMGRSRELFWSDVIQPIWRSSRRATLVDSYLLKPFRQSRRDEPVEWMLGRMSDAPGMRGAVTLIADAGETHPLGPEDVLERLAPVCAGGRIERLKVHLIPSKGRGKLVPHDRHIRFDTSAVQLGAGFDRLASSLVRDKDGLNWTFRWSKEGIDPLRNAEERALGLRGVESAEWVLT